jgi:hypothetical protein
VKSAHSGRQHDLTFEASINLGGWLVPSAGSCVSNADSLGVDILPVPARAGQERGSSDAGPMSITR